MKKFEQLTIQGQKMRIVQDAIAQLLTKVIIASANGYYFTLDYDFNEKAASKDLKTVLNTAKTPVCKVCAKGALFTGCVANVNEIRTMSVKNRREPFQTKKLAPWFSIEELDTIEAAYEQDVIRDKKHILRDKNHDLTVIGKKAVNFSKSNSEKRRLLAILNNILKNGSFKP